MKKFIYIFALAFILLGGVLLSYSHTGFKSHVHENILSLGPLSIGENVDVTTKFSPLAGYVCLLLGISILVYGIAKR